MPRSIVVKDRNHVEIDGQQAGSITDVLRNHGQGPEPAAGEFRGELDAAIGAWVADLRARREQAHAADLAARDAQHAQAVEAIRAEHAQAIATLQARYAAERLAWESKYLEEMAGKDEAARTLKAEAEAKLKHACGCHERTIAEQRATIEAMGGTELGKKVLDEARCRQLREDRAKIDAQLAAIAGGEGANA